MMDESNFFSIDRLVEFGLGMALARQMVGMMNQTMQSMYVPGSIQSMPQPTPAPQVYYVALEGEPVGPLGIGELSQLIAERRVNKDTLAWVPGMATWQPVEQVPAILRVIAMTPPPLTQPHTL